MATFTDTFNRADGTTNGVNGWVSLLGTWTVASNELKITTTHNTAALIQTGTPMATADHYAEIRVRNMVSTFGPIIRNDGTAANFYMLRRASGTTLTLYKNVAGATSTLATVNYALVAGDVMRIEAEGAVLKGYVNGVQVITATDSAPLTGLYTGIRTTGNAQNATWDDFGAADIGATTPPETPSTVPFRLGATVPARVYMGTSLIAGVAFGTAPAPEVPSVGTASFGPNGTHYPANTPDPKSPAGKVIITSAPTGSAIRASLDALTTAQIDQGVIIALTAGTLSSSDTWSALDGFQNTRTNRITICPKAGYGTVGTSAEGIFITGARGINLCGLSIEKLQLKGCNDVTASRCQINYNYVSITTTATLDSNGCSLYEVVMLDSVVKSSDSAQFQNQTSGRLLSNVTVAGCVLAPCFYVDGIYNEAGYPDRPHTDTLQLTSSSTAPTQNINIIDSQIWTSNNCAIILSGPIDGTVFDNTLVVGGSTAQVRYPFKAGGAGYAGAINGPGTLAAIQGNGSGNTDAIDSVMIGQLSPDWRNVVNSKSNLSSVVGTNGAFTSVPAMASYTDSDFTALGAPKPTAGGVAALWGYSPL